MPDIYRIVCSENQRLYPNKTFIDFMPAGNSRPENSLNHESILKMRQMINPEVHNIENGMLFYDMGNGEYLIKYEKVYSYSVRRHQEYVQANYNQQIIDCYKNMKEAGREKTLEVSLVNMAVVFDFYKLPEDNSPKSAQETALRQKAADYKRQLQKREQMLTAKKAYAEKHSSETMLYWKEALHRYRGD